MGAGSRIAALRVAILMIALYGCGPAAAATDPVPVPATVTVSALVLLVVTLGELPSAASVPPVVDISVAAKVLVPSVEVAVAPGPPEAFEP